MSSSIQFQKLIIGNWKSHKNQTQARDWLIDFAQNLIAIPDESLKVVVAPPYPLLPVMAEAIAAENKLKRFLELGVQDMSPFSAGSYTGAVSGLNLEPMPITTAIIGHSDRRRYFHETDQEIAQKVDQALQHDILPVVCVDDDQIDSQAAALSDEQRSKVVLAYEPLAAIGSGKPWPVQKVEAAVSSIKAAFGEVKVLYGGSVAFSTVADYLAVTDGSIVGSASLKPTDFADLLRAIE